MSVVVRFAPSPTGFLHLGNARAALVNWLYARRDGGRFVLRMDDTDRERSRAEYALAIERDLGWLGLEWELVIRQSERLDHYDSAAARLRESGRLYPCFETPDELDLKRRLTQAGGRPYVYDRAALSMSEAERSARLARGERPHWRFRLDHRSLAWDDLVRGTVVFQGDHLSDPVLVRADGTYLYTLTSVVDDIDIGITDIVRGEDHVANTAVQIDLFEALGASAPAFAHLPLIADAGGAMLSKRAGSLSLAAIRDEEGIEPLAVASYLAKIGTADPVEPRMSLAALAAEFAFEKIGRAPPRLDLDEIVALNAKLLHATAFEEVAHRLPKGADRAFWEAVRPNLLRVADALPWWAICSGPIEPVIEDADVVAAGARLLPETPWDGTVWSSWTKAVREATGKSGRNLFLPLRKALTGRDHGPDLGALLPVIGRERALRRLKGEVA